MAHPAVALAFRSSPFQGSNERGLEVHQSVEPFVQSPSNPLPAGELIQKLFFGSSRTLSATLGGIHPALPRGKIHPSTSDGLRSLVDHMELGIPKIVPRLATPDLDGSVAILGGPVANLHARLIMGCGGTSPLFGEVLPASFECPAAHSDRTEPWRLVVEGRSFDKECLVITSMPMGRDRLTIFSGLHGAGTRAIKFLFSSRSTLDELFRKTRKLEGWQCVFEVRARDYEKPLALGDHRVLEMSKIDFDHLDIRKRMVLDEHEIKQLVQLLPPSYKIDLSDPMATGMDKVVSLNMYQAKRRGRPPKAQSDAILTRRLQIMLSDDDVQSIESLMKATGAASMGQVIRDSIQDRLARIVDRKKAAK